MTRALALLSVFLALPVLLFALAATRPPPCSAAGCAGACNPHRAIFCGPGCGCWVQGPDGWGSCVGNGR